MTRLSLTISKKTLKPSPKNVSIARMDEKKFQMKGTGENMRCKLLQKRSAGKKTECSKHLWHNTIEKYIFSELNRCIFHISLKCIKFVIPEILFILVLCNFNFYFKIMWLLPPNNITPHQNKNFGPPPLIKACVCYFLPIFFFFFSPYDSPLKTMKNVFCFT